jgi:hypothetical protein
MEVYLVVYSWENHRNKCWGSWNFGVYLILWDKAKSFGKLCLEIVLIAWEAGTAIWYLGVSESGHTHILAVLIRNIMIKHVLFGYNMFNTNPKVSHAQQRSDLGLSNNGLQRMGGLLGIECSTK